MANKIGDQIQLFIFRLPKKNHDEMVHLGKQATDMFMKLGVRSEVFQLNNIKTYEDMGFINIAKAASASPDEEIWVEIQFYRDRKHHDEVGAKMQSDERASQLGLHFMELITPGSCVEGEFGKVGF